MQIDWITDATIEALRDKGKIRGPHYSWYISEQEATEIASAAAYDNNLWYDYTDEFCNREYLYGDPRHEVNMKVMAIHIMLTRFLGATEWE